METNGMTDVSGNIPGFGSGFANGVAVGKSSCEPNNTDLGVSDAVSTTATSPTSGCVLCRMGRLSLGCGS